MELGNKVLIGAFWMTASTWGIRVIGMCSTIILARLLLPIDYGIVASASLVVNFLNIMSDMGTDAYLMRINNIKRDDYNTAWSLNLIIRFCIATLLFSFAETLSVYYNDNRLEDVWKIMSITIAISGLQSIGLAKLKKEFKYNKIFLYNISSKTIGFIATISLVFYYKSYFGMIYGSLISSIFELLSSYLISNYKPCFSVKNISEQWTFSKWILVKNISGFIRQKYDLLLISKYFGVESMGMYSMATDIANLPAEMIYPSLGPIYAGYTELLEDKEKLNSAFVTVLGVIFVLAFPMFVGLYFVSYDAVLFFLGSKWLNIVEIIQLMTLLVMLQIVCFAANGFIVAKGKIRKSTLIDFIYTGLLIPILYHFLIYHDIAFIVIGRLISYFILTSAFLYVAIENLQLLVRIIKVVIRPLFASLLMLVFLKYIQEFLFYLSLGSRLSITVVFGCFFYSVILLSTWYLTGRKEGGEYFLLSKIKIPFARYSIFSGFK